MHKQRQFCAPSSSDLCTFALFSTEESERLNDGNGAILSYKQIVAPVLSEWLYGGIGEKSIGYPRKVYRVFSDRTKQTLRSLPSSTPFPSYKRSDTSHPSPHFLRTNTAFPPILGSDSVGEMRGRIGRNGAADREGRRGYLGFSGYLLSFNRRLICGKSADGSLSN